MENLKIISDKPINVYSLSGAADLVGVSKNLLEKGIEDGTLKYVMVAELMLLPRLLENFFQCCREYL